MQRRSLPLTHTHTHICTRTRLGENSRARPAVDVRRPGAKQQLAAVPSITRPLQFLNAKFNLSISVWERRFIFATHTHTHIWPFYTPPTVFFSFQITVDYMWICFLLGSNQNRNPTEQQESHMISFIHAFVFMLQNSIKTQFYSKIPTLPIMQCLSHTPKMFTNSCRSCSIYASLFKML